MDAASIKTFLVQTEYNLFKMVLDATKAISALKSAEPALEPAIRELKLPVVPFNFANPAVKTTPAPAASLNLTMDFKQLDTFLQGFIENPATRASLAGHMMPAIKRDPELLIPLQSLLETLKMADAKPLEFQSLIRSVVRILDSPTVDDNQNSHFEGFQNQQILRQIGGLLTSQGGLPSSTKMTLPQTISWIESASQLPLSQMETEIFALPVLQGVGLSPQEYQLASHSTDPLRLALLVLSLKNNPANESDSQKLVATFLKDVRSALDLGKDVLPIVKKWESETGFKFPLESLTALTQKGIPYPSQGIGFVKEGATASVVIAALSPKLGLLTSDHIQSVIPNAFTISFQGCLLMAQMLPKGASKIKLKIDDEEGNEAFLEFLFYCFASDGEEARPAPPQEIPYDCVDIKPHLKPPLAGQISLTFPSPYILTRPYKEGPISSPLQVDFKFLVDVVDSDTLYSREKFLSLNQSAEGLALRHSVWNLAKEGMGAYDGYLKALDDLFYRIKDIFKDAHRSFDDAKKYLRDEVLLLLMGKKTPGLISGRPNQSVQVCPKGDILASVCSTTALMMSKGEMKADALIQFVDATKLAENGPYYMQRLNEFLNGLRNNTRGESRRGENEILILPPSSKEKRTSDQKTAKVFVSNMKLLQA